jgi:hypothetical protein
MYEKRMEERADMWLCQSIYPKKNLRVRDADALVSR